MDRYPGFVIMKTPKELANRCRVWNKQILKKEQSRAEEISKQIEAIDVKEEANDINETDVHLRTSLKADLLNISLLETQKWRQLCKLNWLLEGDENTTYFHNICLARRRYNFIAEIYDESSLSLYIDDKIEITFLIFFKDIFIGPAKHFR